MHRNERFDTDSDVTVPERDLQLLFTRSAPDLGPVDVDALFASSQAGEGRAVKVGVGWRQTGELASAAFGIRNSSSTPLARRTIMGARVVAATLLVGGAAALLLILGHTGANSVLAEVQQSLREVQSVTFDVSTRRGEEKEAVVRVMLLGKDLGRAEHANDGVFTIFDRKQRKMMKVNPGDQKAIILTNVEGQNPIPNLFDMLVSASKKSVGELDDREIGGKTLKGFVIDFRGQRLNVWVNPDTNLPERIEERHILKDQTVIDTIFTAFVYNSNLDETQFRIEPPQGYDVEFLQLHSIEEQKRRAMEQDRKALQRAAEAARARRKKQIP